MFMTYVTIVSRREIPTPQCGIPVVVPWSIAPRGGPNVKQAVRTLTPAKLPLPATGQLDVFTGNSSRAEHSDYAQGPRRCSEEVACVCTTKWRHHRRDRSTGAHDISHRDRAAWLAPETALAHRHFSWNIASIDWLAPSSNKSLIPWFPTTPIA